MLTTICNLALAGYLTWEMIRGPGLHRRFKRQIAAGDPTGRTRYYQTILRFELVSALGALLALWAGGHGPSPAGLGFEDGLLRLGRMGEHGFHGLRLTAQLVWVAVVAGALARRRLILSGERRRPWVLPEVAVLLPASRAERRWFAAVAVAAGVCEEVVFRGWLLDFLHLQGLTGGILVLAAAAVFGIAHAYQGPVGVVLTGCLGVLFCALYLATGSLLLPIALHVLLDLRFAFIRVPPTGTVTAGGVAIARGRR